MSWVCIDFGTCNSAAAISVGGVPKVVEPFVGIRTFPTIACIPRNNRIVACAAAEPFRATHPQFFLQEFKLDIDQPLNCNECNYRQVVSKILEIIKAASEAGNNGQSIDGAIITIPVIYTRNDPRKIIMQQSAFAAGFQNVEFMSEPVAAAYHFSDVMGRGQNGEGVSLIYDLGCGTFDATLLKMTNGAPEILGHGEGLTCGGRFFDAAIYNYFANVANQDGNPLDRCKRLEDMKVCQILKEALSTNNESEIIFSNGVTYRLGRNQFEQLIQDKINSTIQACDDILQNAHWNWGEIDRVLLVGGSTNIPLVRHMLHLHTKVPVISNQNGINNRLYESNFAVCLGGIAHFTPDTHIVGRRNIISIINKLVQGILHNVDRSFMKAKNNTNFNNSLKKCLNDIKHDLKKKTLNVNNSSKIVFSYIKNKLRRSTINANINFKKILSFKNNKLKKKSIDADNNLKRCVNPRCRKFILESANYCIYCGIKQTDRIDLTPPK